MCLVGIESIGVGNFEWESDSCAPDALCVAGVDEDCVVWGGEHIRAVFCEGKCLGWEFRRHERGLWCGI